MSQIIELSDGTKVHFKEKWTHKADRLFKQTLKKGVVYKHDMEAGKIDPVEEIPAGNWDLAYEAVLPMLVEKIAPQGSETRSFSQEWLDDLSPEDYGKLEATVYRMKNSLGEGEKNPAGAG